MKKRKKKRRMKKLKRKKKERKLKNKEETKENKAEFTEPIVTPLSLDSKNKAIDEEEDDALSIQGPLDMDRLSSTELMEISTAMQS